LLAVTSKKAFGSVLKGVRTGDPISLDSGYTFDGLVRNTAVQIDSSGDPCG
jgi:hypothetical protein